jgi:hypothetical protein
MLSSDVEERGARHKPNATAESDDFAPVGVEKRTSAAKQDATLKFSRPTGLDKSGRP